MRVGVELCPEEGGAKVSLVAIGAKLNSLAGAKLTQRGDMETVCQNKGDNDKDEVLGYWQQEKSFEGHPVMKCPWPNYLNKLFMKEMC